jgi:hypothetical protein
MLRLHIREAVMETATVSLEGRVIGLWMEELRRVCKGILARGARLVPDLSEVVFVRKAGIDLFRRLRDRQVVFRNCSLFVGEQLKG